MRRLLFIAGLFALLPVAGVCAQERPAEAKPAKPAAKGKGKANGEAPAPLERWNRMTPEERRQALAKLTPERRRELQEKLRQYRNLPPDQRQQLGERYKAFSQLPPEQQNRARDLFRQFNSLPEDRRPMVKQEYEQLRSMPESERNERMNSEAFRNRYTPSEQQMLRDLSQTFGSSR